MLVSVQSGFADLQRALWASCKLPEQTDLFIFAQDPNFGPRHTLIILPSQHAESGKTAFQNR